MMDKFSFAIRLRSVNNCCSIRVAFSTAAIRSLMDFVSSSAINRSSRICLRAFAVAAIWLISASSNSCNRAARFEAAVAALPASFAICPTPFATAIATPVIGFSFNAASPTFAKPAFAASAAPAKSPANTLPTADAKS